MDNPIEQRRREERDQRKQAFLEAGFAEVFEKGIAKLTLASVAQRARLSKSLVYFYFKHKQDLVVALANDAKLKLLEAFHDARTTATLGRDQLCAIGHTYLSFPYVQPHRWEVMAQIESVVEPNADETEHYADAQRLAVAITNEVAGAIHAGRADGSLAKTRETPEQIAILLWSFLYGYNRLSTARGDAIEQICGVNVKDLAQSALIHVTIPLLAEGTERSHIPTEPITG